MAAKKGGSRKAATGRGRPEAVEKRRTARELNTLLGGASDKKLDGRTEKRRKRLVKELKTGRRGTPLKPIEVVSHVDELLEIGETLSSLRKQGVKARKTEASPEVLDAVKRTQKAYGFRPEAWKMLGVTVEGAKKGPGRPRKASSRRK
jgi:hypothetical protein